MSNFWTRDFFKKCVALEVYGTYKQQKRLSLIDKVYCKFFKPETNSVYLIRKYLFLANKKSRFSKARSRMIASKLIWKYGISIQPHCLIDLGLRIIHPSNIMICNVKIGKNLTLYQNVTIGTKHFGYKKDEYAEIGDNVTFYSNSGCFGTIKITNDVTIGCFSSVFHDIVEPGVYFGLASNLKRKE